MNKTNRSNFTSLSFTVEDDLISQASVSTYLPDRKFTKNPFSKNYEIKGLDNNNNFGQQNYSNNNKIQQQIRQDAQRQAYKELNNDLYNPFEHKLDNKFIPYEQNLYEKQKRRQIQYLKRKQQEQLNSNKNYTIVFNNNQQKKTLKLAASNVLNQQKFSIQEYYNKNIMKRKQMKQIQQDDDQNGNNQGQDKNNKYQSKNNINYNLKQNNQINQKSKPYQKKVQSTKNINKSKKQVSVSYSNKQIPTKIQNSIKNTSIQKPKTSKQIKKPVNNYVNINNKQQKPKIPTNKNNTNSYPTKLTPIKDSFNNQTKKKYSQVYQGADKNLVEQIETQIAQQTNITFQEIAELQNAKSLLQQAILLPKIMPQFFKGIRKAMKGILMFGPPGTGKTLLAKAVANDNMFFNVSASSLASKWKGESQKMVRILFEMARYHSPSIIFFDQIDAIASKRSEGQHQSSRKVKTQLLVQMDGVQSSEHQVFVLAATNRPWDLDEALRRRLQKRIYIPLPEKQGRRKMFDINLKDVKLNQKINWERIAKQTDGYSGADISNVCRDAAYMPMRRMLVKVGIKKMAEINQKQLLAQELSQKDLIEAIKNNKPSVNLDDLKKYQKWMKQFGSQ